MSEQQPPFDPLETANQYTDYEAQVAEEQRQAEEAQKRQDFEQTWLGMHGDAETPAATPAEVQQAARDTANYFANRPANEEEAAATISDRIAHYNEPTAPTDQEKPMKKLIAEQAQAEVNGDRTRSNDIQEELNGRIITTGEGRDEKYDEATRPQQEREAYRLNAAFNQKERIKAGLTPEAGAPDAPEVETPDTSEEPETPDVDPTENDTEAPVDETPEADDTEAPTEDEPAEEADDSAEAPAEDTEVDPNIERIRNMSEEDILAVTEAQAATLSVDAYAALLARQRAIEAARADIDDINDGHDNGPARDHEGTIIDTSEEAPIGEARLAELYRATRAALGRYWRSERGSRTRDQIARVYRALVDRPEGSAEPTPEEQEELARRGATAAAAGRTAVDTEVEPESRRTLRERFFSGRRGEVEHDRFNDMTDEEILAIDEDEAQRTMSDDELHSFTIHRRALETRPDGAQGRWWLRP